MSRVTVFFNLSAITAHQKIGKEMSVNDRRLNPTNRRTLLRAMDLFLHVVIILLVVLYCNSITTCNRRDHGRGCHVLLEVAR